MAKVAGCWHLSEMGATAAVPGPGNGVHANTSLPTLQVHPIPQHPIKIVQLAKRSILMRCCRSVEKTIRTEIASAALRGIGVPRTPEEEAAAVAAAAATAKGAKGAKKGTPVKAAPAAAASGSTGRKGSAGSGGRNAGKGGSGVDDSEDSAAPPIFSSELAVEWAEIVEQVRLALV